MIGDPYKRNPFANLKDQVQVNKTDIRWLKEAQEHQKRLLYSILVALISGFGGLIVTIFKLFNDILKVIG